MKIDLLLLLQLKEKFPSLVQSSENENIFTFDTKYHNIRKLLEIGTVYNSQPYVSNYPIHVDDYPNFSEEMLEYYEFIKEIESLILSQNKGVGKND